MRPRSVGWIGGHPRSCCRTPEDDRGTIHIKAFRSPFIVNSNVIMYWQSCLVRSETEKDWNGGRSQLRPGDPQRPCRHRHRHFRLRHRHRGGRIAQLGAGLAPGGREIDAAGRVVTPGGVDAHCHLDQPMEAPARMADDFDSGTRSAACGGTTTVIPFAAQAKGQSLRAAVARLPPPRRRPRPRRLRLPPDRQRPDPGGAEGRAAGADRRGLHLVQDLHDLRRPQARRRPDPRRAGRGAAARRDGHDPRRERRLHRVADAAAGGQPAAPRRASTRMPGRCWWNARPRTARSRCRELVDVPILIVHVSGARGRRADPLGARRTA